MKTLYLATIIMLSMMLSAVAQNSKKEEKKRQKEEQYQAVLNLVASGKFDFFARKANTQKGRQVDLTTRGNYLRIDGESASADMPYFGRAFSAGYSNSDGGINFDGQMEEHEVEQNDKKQRVLIKFKVRSPDDTFSCALTIYSIQSATLSVTSNKRQAISYNGEMTDAK